MNKFTAVATVVFLAMVAPALAQDAQQSGLLIGEMSLHGQGWSQITNLQEIGQFALALLETGLMAAALAWHPADVQRRGSRESFVMPRDMMTFALIGMIVGFLVYHHGYLIGFVIFGIGGLLRFKTEFGTEETLVRLIVATLVGLTIGLDLPVMALILTASVWVITFVSARQRLYLLEVQFDDRKGAKPRIAEVTGALATSGIITRNATRKRFKSAAEFVIELPRGLDPADVRSQLDLIQRDKALGVLDWHLEHA